MKRNIFLKAAAALIPGIALMFSACDKSTYEQHMTRFYPIDGNGKIIYADQTNDSIHLLSLDNWSTYIQGADGWLSVSPTTGQTSEKRDGDWRIDITTTVNTTGQVRLGYVMVKTDAKKQLGDVGMPVRQVYWLNVQQPAAVNTTPMLEADPTKQTVAFPMAVKAAAADTSVIFTVYSDATLSAEADWVKPATTTFKAGSYKVKVSVDHNTTGAARTGRLVLTSAGVSTPILFNQTDK